ncbi:MAG: hypothetical protein HY810_08270 [Candidatus Omnitrophica bacterium]|nr:hypothetical protein [Candidatus Omnitrophota bacterium]
MMKKLINVIVFSVIIVLMFFNLISAQEEMPAQEKVLSVFGKITEINLVLHEITIESFDADLKKVTTKFKIDKNAEVIHANAVNTKELQKGKKEAEMYYKNNLKNLKVGETVTLGYKKKNSLNLVAVSIYRF